MFLGGSILSFVLPMAAFIVIAGALFYLYRRPHYNPRLNYMSPGDGHLGGHQGAGPGSGPGGQGPGHSSGRRRHGNRGARNGDPRRPRWPRLRLKGE